MNAAEVHRLAEEGEIRRFKIRISDIEEVVKESAEEGYYSITVSVSASLASRLVSYFGEKGFETNLSRIGASILLHMEWSNPK